MFQTIHRLQDTLVTTKARPKKVGQHKLGSSGYMNLQSRLVSSGNEISYIYILYIMLQTILFYQIIHSKLMILRKKYRAQNSMWRS